MNRRIYTSLLFLLAGSAAADDLDEAPVESAVEPSIVIHGFVSQGAFVSTDNDYLGKSSRGSFELFEAGLNVQTELSDRLRAGMQLFSRDVGDLGDYAIKLDWAFLDYRYRPWLGLRAGHIKLPFGLYNEYTDIDASRVTILMPQGVYPIDSRDVLLAHTGFSGYGTYLLGDSGSLDYQLFAGTWFIPASTSTTVRDADVETKYVAGGQLFWRSRDEDLRVGASFLRSSVDFNFVLGQELIDYYVMMGTVPEDFDGKVALRMRPVHLLIGSAEYMRGRWLFAAEYSRWLIRFYTQPEILPLTDSDSERFYALTTYQLRDDLFLGAYYSVYHADTNDRAGRDKMRFPIRHRAFQRDAALTLRYDVTDRWLWKLEGHFIDGAADLDAAENPMPERYWGMFLVRTTLAF